MSRKIVFEPHTWIEDTLPYIIPHFPFLLSATSHWIRTHPSQVWPHFNLITSLKTLFPNKVTSQIPEVRTRTPLIEQFKSQHTVIYIFHWETLLFVVVTTAMSVSQTAWSMWPLKCIENIVFPSLVCSQSALNSSEGLPLDFLHDSLHWALPIVQKDCSRYLCQWSRALAESFLWWIQYENDTQ